MKTLKCDICDYEVQGDTFEEWMNALKPHYGEAHADVMDGKTNLSEDEKMTEMKKWMDENKTRFDTA